jgi:hypothetical protein
VMLAEGEPKPVLAGTPELNQGFGF